MFEKLIGFSVTIALGTVFFNLALESTIARQVQQIEAAIAEDDLSTRKGISWGGGNFPYSQVVAIQDSLVNAPVGRVVLDKHGIDESSSGLILIQNPFSSPAPGKSVFITLWGSKIEGCFVEAVVQLAPEEKIVPESIIPTMLEVGISDRIVQLSPQKSRPKLGSFKYKYTVNKAKRSGTWYMARQIFAIDSGTAKLLSSVSAQEVKARLNFGDDDSLVIPIGVETVKRWKQVYSFNPACASSAKK